MMITSRVTFKHYHITRWWAWSCFWFPGAENENENWPSLSICPLTVLGFRRWETEAQEGKRVAQSSELAHGPGHGALVPASEQRSSHSTCFLRHGCCRGPAPSWGHRSQRHGL